VKFLSVCSGIEAASVAWRPLGWQAVAFAEIEKFPAAVLRHHYPDVENHGDMTRFPEWPDAAIDVLVGGTPCQSFSVAGLRKGLDDPRGSLLLVYLAIARRYRPAWLVWENVPGVLSIDDGRAFGSLLGGLALLGYGFAYRTLDAQYFGLAQRRHRVFVVGHLGDWRRAAAVLFERASLSGHPAPRREAGQSVAPTIGGCSNGGGANGPGRDVDSVESLVAHALCGSDGGVDREDRHTLIAHSLRADGFDASEDGTGRGTPIVPITLAIRGRGDSSDLECRQDGTANAILTPNGGRAGIGVGAVAYGIRSDAARTGEARTPSPDAEGRVRLRDAGFNIYENVAPTIDAGAAHSVAFADVSNVALSFTPGNLQRGAGPSPTEELCMTMVSPHGRGRSDQDPHVMKGMQVRRLTPRECERLQGFPDDYTLIPYNGKPAKDGPRYKALGNSMAVPVMAWIGKRIAMVNQL
jgi:DNA (cytosine-5)-methyltransferase 1